MNKGNPDTVRLSLSRLWLISSIVFCGLTVGTLAITPRDDGPSVQTRQKKRLDRKNRSDARPNRTEEKATSGTTSPGEKSTATFRPVLDDPTTVGTLPDRPEFELTRLIDRRINEALSKANLKSSAVATDAEFLRRACLDLAGRIPSYERTVEFLNDTNTNKRTQLIDELLDSSAFGRHIANLWADMLIKRDADTNRSLNAEPFVDWLAKQFNDNQSWDTIVREMVTASGNVTDNPATFFTIANQDNNQPSPAKLVAATSNLFMGIQLQCAECHVHPVTEKWTQQDFWGMAAFFGHVIFEREGDKVPRAPIKAVVEVSRQSEPKGRLQQKLGIKAISPGDTIKIPDPTDAKKSIGTAKARYFEAGDNAELGAQTPFRPKLAEWLTAKENKYFARAAVNRIWCHVFAKGIVHPIEDMGPEREVTHPELLEELSKAFMDANFDIKFILRAICNSQAYQRTSKPTADNKDDDVYLSHMPIKVIGARELLDSLTLATGNSVNRPTVRPRAAKGAQKGIQAPTTGIRFFDKREYEDEVTDFSYGVSQLLKQMNTSMTNNLNVVNRMIKAGKASNEIITDLFLTILNRRPRTHELERFCKFADDQSDKQKAYNDIAWALLNSAEFVSNH